MGVRRTYKQNLDETPSLTPVTHRGIALHVTDCGTWMWASDDYEAADMAATLDEAKAHVDRMLGPEGAACPDVQREHDARRRA